MSIPIKLLSFQRVQQKTEQTAVLRNEPLFTLIIVAPLKSNNSIITNLQSNLLQLYKNDIKIFRCSKQDDVTQIIHRSLTNRIQILLDHEIDIHSQKIFDSIAEGLKLAQHQQKIRKIQVSVALSQLENKSLQTFFHPLVSLVTCNAQILQKYFEEQIKSTRSLVPAESSSSLNSQGLQNYQNKLNRKVPVFLNNYNSSRSQISIEALDNGVPGVGTYFQPQETRKGFSMTRQSREVNPQSWKQNAQK